MEPTKKFSKSNMNNGYRLVFPIRKNGKGSISGVESAIESGGETIEPVVPPDFPSAETGVRLSLSPISNAEVQRQIHFVEQYLRESGIIANIQNFTTTLLNSSLLPYNPYPGFVKRFRQLSERFHLFKPLLHDIRLNLDIETYKVGTGILHGIKGGQGNLWGLDHILSHVNPKVLDKYLSIVPSVTISSEEASVKCGQKVSLLVSLSGPCVFSGSFYPTWNNLELKVAALLASNDLVSASTVFLNLFVAELNYMKSKDNCILMGVQIPFENQVGWTNRTYSRKDILKILSNYTTGETQFKQLVSHAIVSKKRITLNFLVIKKGTIFNEYIPASKVYNLMLIQSGLSNQSLTSRKSKQSLNHLVISTLPFQALHEGVFYDRQQADNYLSSFQKYYATSFSGKQTFIDPMTPDKLQPIIQAWQMKIASSELGHVPFPTVHYALLLYMAQSRIKSFAKHNEDDLAIQVCRFLRGNAAKLKNISFFTEAIKQILSFEGDNFKEQLNELIFHTQKLLLNFVEENADKVSTEMASLKQIVTTTCVNTNQSNLLSEHRFQELNDNILFLIYKLSTDAVEQFAAILLLKSRIDATFPHLLQKKKFTDKQQHYPHGIKSTHWPDVDALKIDKQFVTKNSQAPKSIAPYFTLMQYSADCRLDETWVDFFKAILLYDKGLPPNPYPILLSHLRRGNTRMQCLFENDRISSMRLVQDRNTKVEQFRNIFNIPGTPAFGTRASLKLVNILGFRQSMEIAGKVIPVPPGSTITGGPLLSGSFQIAICCGISPPSTYYGSVSPFMPYLSLNEYYFVNGPIDHHQPGAVALSKLILSHLVNLKRDGVVLHQAHFGGIVLYLRSIVSSHTRFESEFSAAVTGSKIIKFSFFYPLKSRYILVKKRLFIHFINEENKKLTPMYGNTTLFENCSMTIFLHPEDANHCCNSMKLSEQNSMHKNQITIFWKSMQWPQLLKNLVCNIVHERSSKSSENDMYSESIFAFSWRFYNSIPGQIYYLLELNKAIQGILRNASFAVEEGLPVNSVLDPSLVEIFLLQYRTKLNEVLERQSCLLPVGVSDYLQEKLNIVAFRNPQTNEFFVKYDNESVRILIEINGFLQVILNSSTKDLLEISPNVLKYINIDSI